MAERSYQALLAAVMREIYTPDKVTHTEEDLQNQLFPDMDAAAFSSLHSSCAALLQSATQQRLDVTKIEQFLEKHQPSPELRQAFDKFWRGQRHRVLAHAEQNTSWNTRLTNLAWRVDVTARASNKTELHQPSAIAELQLSSPADGTARTCQFEVSRPQLDAMLEDIEKIEQVFK